MSQQHTTSSHAPEDKENDDNHTVPTEISTPEVEENHTDTDQSIPSKIIRINIHKEVNACSSSDDDIPCGQVARNKTQYAKTYDSDAMALFSSDQGKSKFRPKIYLLYFFPYIYGLNTNSICCTEKVRSEIKTGRNEGDKDKDKVVTTDVQKVQGKYMYVTSITNFHVHVSCQILRQISAINFHYFTYFDAIALF